MKTIEIGRLPDGKPLKLDLDILLETRLLIQGSSGSGKSMTVRTLLEKTHGLVPQIVLDLEGDFATLREKYDFVLAGKDGDIPADPRTAALLARKVMELDLSLIVDLFDLAPGARHEFVRNFLRAMLDAPKDLWRHRLLVIDEAHKFCPENGEGSSVAKETVIQVCDSGRKRGIGTVLATQRLAKLDKSAAAECGNKLIGMTFYDDDRKRAARELGLRSAEETHALGQLEPGHFMALGRALSRDLVQASIDKAITRHPKAGNRAKFKAPKPTARVKANLAKLVDLPKEAEKEAQDMAAAQGQIRELKVKLVAAERQAKTPPAAPAPAAPSKEMLAKHLEQIKASAQVTALKAMSKMISELERNIAGLVTEAAKTFQKQMNDQMKVLDVVPRTMPIEHKPQRLPQTSPQMVIFHKPTVVKATVSSGQNSLGLCERELLGLLGSRADYAFTRAQAAALLGRAAGGGSFQNAIGKLAGLGLIERQDDKLQLVAGVNTEEHGGVQPGPGGLAAYISKLYKAEAKIYQQLLDHPAKLWTKEELAEATEYQAGGGSFQNAIGRLNTLKLLVRQGGAVKLNPELQELL